MFFYRIMKWSGIRAPIWSSAPCVPPSLFPSHRAADLCQHGHYPSFRGLRAGRGPPFSLGQWPPRSGDGSGLMKRRKHHGHVRHERRFFRTICAPTAAVSFHGGHQRWGHVLFRAGALRAVRGGRLRRGRLFWRGPRPVPPHRRPEMGALPVGQVILLAGGLARRSAWCSASPYISLARLTVNC